MNKLKRCACGLKSTIKTFFIFILSYFLNKVKFPYARNLFFSWKFAASLLFRHNSYASVLLILRKQNLIIRTSIRF